jgi:hypothetical protein
VCGALREYPALCIDCPNGRRKERREAALGQVQRSCRSMVCYAIFAASLRPAFQALQHQRQPERDAEVDHVDTGGRLFELRGDVSPS